MRSYKLRPATKAEIQAFGWDGQYTVKAMVGECNGEPVGMAGIIIYPHVNVMFMDMKHNAPPRRIWWATKEIMKAYATKGKPLVACAKNTDTAKRFLERIGFEQLEGDWYQWKSH